ncbi:MAG: protein kinase [Sandaracinaceae bacterium]|nr:protein kinase [Sandaracinaceae bacterium]
MPALSERSADTSPVATDPHLGAILGGRYQVVERLGEGGMGAVYRAQHLELGRDVAVKLLAPELSRKRTSVERFQREARTASKIGHPNIVDVFDLGRGQDGTPYLVMQLLDGHDLQAELRAAGGVLPAARVVEILGPIANALDTCHARGVIHRDIKPSNIFLARLGDGSVSPKLVDFGLAMLVASDERLTKSGFLAGTAHYLPPEAAHGDLPGSAGDTYALATVAFEALCGQLPFDVENSSGLLVQKVLGPAPTMATVTTGEFPADVEAVLAKALHRDPERRHASAGAFVTALAEAVARHPDGWGPDRSAPPKPRSGHRALVEGAPEPVSSVRESALSRAIAPPPWRRWPVLAAAALLLALVVGAAWWGSATGDTTSPVVPPDEPGAELPPVASSPTADPAPADTAPADTVPPSETAPADTAPADTAPPSEAARPSETAPSDEAPRSPTPARAAERPADSDEPVAEPAAPAPVASEPARARPREPEAPAPARDRAEAERLVQSAGSLLVRGDLAAATELLERARAADPTYAPTYRSLGLAHERARRTAAARAAFERYLRLAPGASDAARIRARLAELEE